MARFDIYSNPIVEDRQEFPFVLQIQSDLLYQFTERVCVPLARPQAVPGLTERFNPTIEVAGESLRLHPLGISVFYVNELRTSIASAQTRGLDIETSIDMLLRGY